MLIVPTEFSYLILHDISRLLVLVTLKLAETKR